MVNISHPKTHKRTCSKTMRNGPWIPCPLWRSWSWSKKNHTAAELKSLTLEMLNRDYPPSGSAKTAVWNGGGGVYIQHPDSSEAKSVATGQFPIKIIGEHCALLHAAQTLNTRAEPLSLPDWLSSPSPVFNPVRQTRTCRTPEGNSRHWAPNKTWKWWILSYWCYGHLKG